MKKFLIILIIIFICGILSADICLKQIQESNVLVDMDFYKGYANAKLAFKDVFWNVLYERTKFFGMLLLFCFTPLKEKMGILFATMFCFIWGFYLMSCITGLGIAGLVVGLASVLPHGILYGVVIGMLLLRRNKKKYYVKNQVAIIIGSYVFQFLVFLTACIIETLVGIHFIPWIIRLSLI